MPVKPSLRPWYVLAGMLATAGTLLAVAGCGHIAPIGPDPASVAPPTVPPQHLRSAFVLEAVRMQSPTHAGACPAGSIALSGGPGQCYRRLGTPVRVTSGYVGPVITGTPGIPAGHYGFWLELAAADQSALHAMTTAAAHAHGFLDISVAGRTWLLPQVLQPFTGPLDMVLPSKNQVLQLHRLLFPGPVAHSVTHRAPVTSASPAS